MAKRKVQLTKADQIRQFLEKNPDASAADAAEKIGCTKTQFYGIRGQQKKKQRQAGRMEIEDGNGDDLTSMPLSAQNLVLREENRRLKAQLGVLVTTLLQ